MGGDALSSVETLAMLGGYLQGEGCFDIGAQTPRVRCVNTHKPTLDLLRECFGGSVRLLQAAHGSYRTTWTWQVTGQRAIEVCMSLRKYLGEKTPQACALVEWYKSGPRTQARRDLEYRIKELKRIDHAPDPTD